MSSLPDQFIRGLTAACMQGRAQVDPDRPRNFERPGELTFYLDGAHSPESMEICARWFSLAVQEGEEQQMTKYQHSDDSGLSVKSSNKGNDGSDCNLTRKGKRENVLFIHLLNLKGVYLTTALLIPNISVYYKVGSTGAPQNDSRIALSWQFALQRIWEALSKERKDATKGIWELSFHSNTMMNCHTIACVGGEHPIHDGPGNEVKEDTEGCVKSYENSTVFTSLPLAIEWQRDNTKQNRSVRFQVLDTGSLRLVGDVLRVIKR